MDLKLNGQVGSPEVIRENFNKISKAVLPITPGAAVWGFLSGSISAQTDLTSYVTGLPVSTFSNDAGYLNSFSESDPAFMASAAAGITAPNITNWNTAFGWGNHASAGYLTSASAASTYLPLSTISGLANPSATIGLSASNGSAITAMRSDATPALNQGIVPTWTGAHIFSSTLQVGNGTSGLVINPSGYSSLSDGTGTLLTTFGTVASIPGQPFFQSSTGYWAFQSQTPNTAGRFYILPKGTPSGTSAKFEMFNSDYIADGLNYSGLNIILNNSTNVINFGPNVNGTGTRQQLVIGGNYNASTLQASSPFIKLNTDNTVDIKGNNIITFSNGTAEVFRSTSTGLSIGTTTQTNGKVIIDTNVSAAAIALRLYNLAAGTGNNCALAWGSNGQYGFMDYDPLSTNGVRYSALGPLRFGYNTNAAYGSSTFTEVFRTTTSGTMGIGTGSTISAALHVISLTEQFRLGYNTANYMSTTIGSIGSVTFDLTGTSPTFAFNKAATIAASLTTPLLIGGTGTTSALNYKTTTGVGATGADHVFVGGTNGGTEFMRILNSGNVGIGTNSPATLLHISSSAAVFRVQDSTGNNASFYGNSSDYAVFSINRNPATGSFVNTGKSAAQINLYSVAADGHIEFYTTATNNVTPTERMRILAGGAIGIANNLYIGSATTSASAKLQIAAGTATSGTGPIKLTNQGTALLSTPEVGVFEFGTVSAVNQLFFTRAGTTRETIMTTSAVNSVSPTSPNKTITVVIDGVTYYLAAKTTND